MWSSLLVIVYRNRNEGTFFEFPTLPKCLSASQTAFCRCQSKRQKKILHIKINFQKKSSRLRLFSSFRLCFPYQSRPIWHPPKQNNTKQRKKNRKKKELFRQHPPPPCLFHRISHPIPDTDLKKNKNKKTEKRKLFCFWSHQLPVWM